MNSLQKACIVLIITTITGFGVSAQDDKKPPDKDHTPRVKVANEKVEDKQQNKNRDNDNRNNRDNSKDKGNKKPGI